MSKKKLTHRQHPLISDQTIADQGLTPRQTAVLGWITLWIILAGLWKTVETVWAILSWLL